MAERRVPQLLGDERADGRKRADDVLGHLGDEGGVGCLALPRRHGVEVGVRGVHQLHDGGDGGVELLAVEVLGALGERAMALAVELQTLLGERRLIEGGRVRPRLDELPDGAPSALDEAVRAGHGVRIPIEVLLGRGDEQDRQAHRVGAVGLDNGGRRHHVALGLAHDVAVLVLHHALAEQVGERLVHVEQPHVAERLGEEATVEQVQDGVLDAADVVVHGHPAVGGLAGERQLIVVWVRVADVVPAGAREGVHGVGLAARGATALGTGALVEVLVLGKRLAGTQVQVLGQRDGQVLLRHGHDAALRAMDGRDGVTPVALTGDEPVAQAVLHGALTGARRLQVGHDGRLARGVLAALHAGVLAGLHERALGHHGGVPVHGGDLAALLVLQLSVEWVVVREDDGNDRKVVLLGELEVALVAAGDGHDGTGAVVGDDVVGHPHGNLLAVDRVHHVAAREGTVLLELALGALHRRDVLGILHDLHDGGLVLGARHKLGKALVLGREQEERAAEERVGARGEDGDLGVRRLARGVAEGEVHLGALGAADPVGLHLLHALGPAGQLLEVVKQLLRVGGDLDVPLLEVALLHLGVAAPAVALGHLLIGEHGLALGTPVDGVLLAVDEPALPQLLEDPLAPLVVVGLAGLHHAVEVVGEAHALHGGERLVHVLVGPGRSLGVVLDGRVLGRQAEGVEADGVQHIEAAHAGLARHGVADGVVARMSHVQVARGVREHLEHVLLGLGGVRVHGKEVLLVPRLHPAGLDGPRIVGGHLARDDVAHIRLSFLLLKD